MISNEVAAHFILNLSSDSLVISILVFLNCLQNLNLNSSHQQLFASVHDEEKEPKTKKKTDLGMQGNLRSVLEQLSSNLIIPLCSIQLHKQLPLLNLACFLMSISQRFDLLASCPVASHALLVRILVC